MHVLPMRGIVFASLAAGLLISACQSRAASSAATVAPQSVASQSEAPVVLDLKAGEVLQFALFKTRKGDAAQAVRARYFQTAIPYAKSLGDRELGSYKIERTLVGKAGPTSMAVYAFPDADAQKTFMAAPDWDDYQQMRREGWEELNILSTTVASDMIFTFDPQKTYTFATAWINPGTQSDYETYLDGIEPYLGGLGARYVARFQGVDLQSQTDPVGNPSNITIVEWKDGVDLPGLTQTQGYKDNQASFQKAINRFDFHVFRTPRG